MKDTTYPVDKNWQANANINASDYHSLYQQSMDENQHFWGLQAQRYLTWFEPWREVFQGGFDQFETRWFVDGKLNACYNCVDRHLPEKAHQTALIWEGNQPSEALKLTYQELHEKVCRLANVLLAEGLQPGDRVCIYLPMIPEAVIAMLACARIGVIHTVVFAGFSAEALKTRLQDATCALLITADESFRAEKRTSLKQSSDEALLDCPFVKRVLVVKRSGGAISWNESRDKWYHEATAQVQAEAPIVWMESNDPLFILYTSGSTGKPKGVVHATGGYLTYAATTFHLVFDYQPDDIYWCTADVGWITGHSYLVYGPLLNGATTLVFEGVPDYPDYSRYWQIIDKYSVSIFYTAPTAIRALRREGESWVKASHRRSLRVLGSVGEPINPDVWVWYYTIVGESRCPIVNTWWQTETGGIMLTPLPGATPLQPGAAGWPFLGIEYDLVDEQGQSVPANQSGHLVVKKPWPGLMQTLYGNQARFVETYLKPIAGCYFTGDSGYRDELNHLWITGRDDDVIKVSGHRLGTGELESALISHPAVAEAAVVGMPHAIKGEGIYAFVTLKANIEETEQLKKELVHQVRNQIGPIATLEGIQWVSFGLPKTRSGKIVRRILRQIATNSFDSFGDISTLADTSVLEKLIADRKRQS